MKTTKSKVGGSNSKKGRNTRKCTRYRDLNVRLTNKKRKLSKHLKKHPNDKVAETCLG